MTEELKPTRLTRLAQAAMKGVSSVASGVNVLTDNFLAQQRAAIERSTSLAERQYKLPGQRFASKRGRPFRHYVAAKRQGPFWRQVGTDVANQPIIEKFYRHKFLHATKGWRTFARGLPAIEPMRRPV